MSGVWACFLRGSCSTLLKNPTALLQLPIAPLQFLIAFTLLNCFGIIHKILHLHFHSQLLLNYKCNTFGPQGTEGSRFVVVLVMLSQILVHRRGDYNITMCPHPSPSPLLLALRH